MPRSESGSIPKSVDGSIPKPVEFGLPSYSKSFRNSISSASSSIRSAFLGSVKIKDEIKFQLFKISKPLNLRISLIYGLLCFNWYIIGTQWLPDPHQIPEIECNIEELNNVSWSFYEKRNITNPKNNKYEPGCTYYNYQYYLLSVLTPEEAAEETSKNPKPEILFCKDINIRSDIPIEVSYIKEFDLICRKKALHLVNFLMDIGMILFGFPAGILADMYGRRLLNIFSAIALCATTSLLPFCKNYALYAFGQCITGGCLLSICIALNLIYSEICRRKYRIFTTMLAFAWFMIGSNMPNYVFCLIEVWRLRILAIATSSLIFVFGAIMLTPESPRYLMTKRQFGAAWDCLKELGCTKLNPNVQNEAMSKISLNEIFRELSNPYLQRRLCRVLILKATGVYFFYLFNIENRCQTLETSNCNLTKKGIFVLGNITMAVFMSSNRLKINILIIEILLLICTSIITLNYTKKAIICMYFVLLSLCILTNMIASVDTAIKSVSLIAGIVFASIIYIANVTYIIDIFPTTHRGTVLGFTFSFTAIISTFSEMYHEELVMDEESDYLSAFYCGLCMICALVAITSPNSGADLPDKHYELHRELSSLEYIDFSEYSLISDGSDYLL